MMRGRDTVRSPLRGYSLLILSFSLLMLLYIVVAGGGGDNPQVYASTAALSQAMALRQGSRRRLGPPTSHAAQHTHSIVLLPMADSSERATPEKVYPSRRQVAPRERALATPDRMDDSTVPPDPTGLYVLAILSSVLYGVLLGKRAVDRWIAWEEQELRTHKDTEHPIVFSRTTNEIGYGSCQDWTSDITKFDV